jgi:hypothetical protein
MCHLIVSVPYTPYRHEGWSSLHIRYGDQKVKKPFPANVLDQFMFQQRPNF